jgi:hypothetical protein
VKLALIPPKRWAFFMDDREYHLVLPDQMMFESFAERLATQPGYKILDNGVAEGNLVGNMYLLDCARANKLDEIVIPDSLGNLMKTVTLARAFMTYLDQPGMQGARTAFQYMGVAQGNSYMQVHECIRQFGRIGVNTIGLPRHLCTTIERPARYRIISEWRNNPGLGRAAGTEFHLLGTNPAYIYELRDYGKAFRLMDVRGVDTSAPFTYAMAGEHIRSGDHVCRPENYLDMPTEMVTDRLEELVIANIQTLEDWIAT